MVNYIIRRVLGLIPTMFIIVTLSFFFIRLAPGGPFSLEKKLPDNIIENLERKYNMDKPMLEQYFIYLGQIVRGDLGASMKYVDHDINYFVANNLPASLVLGLIALSFAVIAGVSVGLLSAVKQNSWVDYTGMSIAVIGLSIPSFVVGPILQYFLAIQLKIFPVAGWITGRNGLLALILPAFTLSLLYFAYIARLTRASVIETLRSDYVRTARAKGLRESVVMLRHVLKGSLLPVVSYLGPAFAGIVTGSVIVETIFGVPGIAKFFVQSALARDFTLIMGTAIVYSLILILANLLVDIIYGFLDPRVSYK